MVVIRFSLPPASEAVAKITHEVHISTCWQELFLHMIDVPGAVQRVRTVKAVAVLKDVRKHTTTDRTLLCSKEFEC